jgi:excisionase family DNA binding protein
MRPNVRLAGLCRQVWILSRQERKRGQLSDRLLNADEVATLLSVPVSWVREHTRSGHLPVVELGRYKRYRREAILAYIEEQEAGGAAWRKHRPSLQPDRVAQS